jgi:hypothetical protein
MQECLFLIDIKKHEVQRFSIGDTREIVVMGRISVRSGLRSIELAVSHPHRWKAITLYLRRQESPCDEMGETVNMINSSS